MASAKARGEDVYTYYTLGSTDDEVRNVFSRAISSGEHSSSLAVGADDLGGPRSLARQALVQIKEKDYAEKYMRQGKKVTLVGAAFAALISAAGATLDQVAVTASTIVDLNALVAEDLNHAVRPGTKNGYWWNVNEKAFMYPPAFNFKSQQGAANYRYTLIDDRHDCHIFEAAAPNEPLLPIWAKVPSGMCTLMVEAVDAHKKSLGVVGTKTFWKRAAYKPGTYPAAPRSYREAATMAYDFIFKAQHTRYLLEHGVTDPRYGNNCYPSKMMAAMINAMVHYAKLRPEHTDEALKVGRLAADYLIGISEKPGTPLAGFPPTYETRPDIKQQAPQFAGQMMLIYPAAVGRAYLELAAATGSEKYREAARNIAETYLRLQGEDGTWPLMVYLKDGKSTASRRMCPVDVADFLSESASVFSIAKFRMAAERAYAYTAAGPLKTFNWNGQFEDAGPQEKMYSDLTKDVALEYADYLLNNFANDPKCLADARELLRFSEDLFVFWERPMRADGTCVKAYPPSKRLVNGKPVHHYSNWYLFPAVGEQHVYNTPVDASAARMIFGYLKSYEVTKNPLDLAKAKTLGDSIVRMQFDSGDIPTQWVVSFRDAQFKHGGGSWLNCTVYAARALERLAEIDK